METQIPFKHLSKALTAAAFVVQNIGDYNGGRVFTNKELERKFKISTKVLRLAMREFVPQEIREERRRLIRRKRCFVAQNGVIAIRRKIRLSY